MYGYSVLSSLVDVKLLCLFVSVCRLTAKAVAVLLPILGISWIFGVLAFNTHSLLFLYIFAVFNSLQVRSKQQNPSLPQTVGIHFWLPLNLFLLLLFFVSPKGILCLPVSLSSQLWGKEQCNPNIVALPVLFLKLSLPPFITVVSWFYSLCRSELLSNTKPRCGL